MQPFAPYEQKKLLGTIVVHPTSMNMWLQPVDQKPSFIDILAWLGKNGYDIILPEYATLAFAGAGVFCDGTTMNSYKPALHPAKIPPLHAFVNNFFIDVAKGKYPGISIMQAEPGASDVAKAVEAMRENHRADKPDSDKQAGYEAAKKLLPEHPMTQACTDAVRQSFVANPTKPIFLLCDDSIHFKTVWEASGKTRHYKLNTPGLLRSLQRHAGVLEAIGFDPVVTGDDIIEAMRQARNLVFKGTHAKFGTETIDTSGPIGAGMSYTFSKTMNALAPDTKGGFMSL